MRRLIILFVMLLIAVIALNSWRPGAVALIPIPTPTLLPVDFTLLPTFMPSFPCELQNVDVHDDQLCRFESVHEQIITLNSAVQFIQHDYHIGVGCWDGADFDRHELHVCTRSSGAITILTKNLVTALIPSPEGEWLAFGTMKPVSTKEDSLRPHLYRVRRDGTGLEQLDTRKFPVYAVGAPRDLRWVDDDWIAFSLWDGSGDNGWHPYRLKADGSGLYEPLPDLELTQTPNEVAPPAQTP